MTVQQILEHLRSLPRRSRRELATALLAELNARHAAPSEKQRMVALDRFLSLAGSVHTPMTDVSADKYTHLAEIYADRR